MQPYFFPYVGYFCLIQQADLFVFYDTAQFPKQGWVNRNRILHDVNRWQYLTVPLQRASFSRSYRTPIRDVRMSTAGDWRAGLLRKLAVYEPHAPYFGEVFALVERLLRVEHSRLYRLNVDDVTALSERLGLACEFSLASELDLDFEPGTGAQAKVIEMCERLGADTYINAAGGKDLYDAGAFAERGIELRFLEARDFRYEVDGFEFQPNLSIIDAMMWNPPALIKEFIEQQVSRRHD